MSDIDTLIRDGLAEAVEVVVDPSVDELAAGLSQARSSERRKPGRRPASIVAATAAAVFLVIAAATLIRSPGPPDTVHIDPGTVAPTTAAPTISTPTTETVAPLGPSGFAALGPGWHDIDTAPIVVGSDASVVWAGDRLVLVNERGAWSYAPHDQQWVAMPKPDQLLGPTLVWTGSEVVAVGADSRTTRPITSTATWKPGEAAWKEAGPVGFAPGLVAAGSRGPTQVGGRTALLWTGQRVIDTTHGAAFDPSSRTWTTLPLPADVFQYSGVITVNPVLAGTEVVVQPAGTTSHGLAWNATGTAWRDVAPVGASVMTAQNGLTETAAAVADGRLVLVRGSDGLAIGKDLSSGAWQRFDPVPGAADRPQCWIGSIATVGDRVVIPACTGDRLAVLHGTTWTLTEPNPGGIPYGRFVSTGDALVTYLASDDVEPILRMQVWVP